MIVLRNKNYSSIWKVAKSLFTKNKPVQIDNSVDIKLGEERRSRLKQNPTYFFDRNFGLIGGEQALKKFRAVLGPSVVQEIKKYIKLVRGFARTYCKWAIDNPEAENLLNKIQEDSEYSRLNLIETLIMDEDDDRILVLGSGFDDFIYYFLEEKTWGFDSTNKDYPTLKQILIAQKEYDISRIEKTIKDGDENLVPILDIFKQWLIQIKTKL